MQVVQIFSRLLKVCFSLLTTCSYDNDIMYKQHNAAIWTPALATAARTTQLQWDQTGCHWQQHRLVRHEAECIASVTTMSNMTSSVGQHSVRLLMIHQCHVDLDSSVTDHHHLDCHTSVSVTRPCKFLTQRHNSTRRTSE